MIACTTNSIGVSRPYYKRASYIYPVINSMYAFVLSRPGETDCVVRIARHNDRATALLGLRTHVDNWASTNYGIDLSERLELDKVVIRSIGETIVVSRCVEERWLGYFSSTTAIIPRAIATFSIIDSAVIGHSTHARLVDQIAEEMDMYLQVQADLAIATATIESLQRELEATNAKAQVKQVEKPSAISVSALSSPSILDELVNNRPRLISRASRDARRRCRENKRRQSQRERQCDRAEIE